jgi:hypothetical protein
MKGRVESRLQEALKRGFRRAASPAELRALGSGVVGFCDHASRLEIRGLKRVARSRKRRSRRRFS